MAKSKSKKSAKSKKPSKEVRNKEWAQKAKDRLKSFSAHDKHSKSRALSQLKREAKRHGFSPATVEKWAYGKKKAAKKVNPKAKAAATRAGSLVHSHGNSKRVDKAWSKNSTVSDPRFRYERERSISRRNAKIDALKKATSKAEVDILMHKKKPAAKAKKPAKKAAKKA